MKSNINFVLILIIFFTLIIMSMGMHRYSVRLNQLEDSVNLLQEELRVQEDVFASYLNGTLSKDAGGVE